MISLEQRYAASIYDQVKAREGEYPGDSRERKQYGSMAHKLPILVRQAGLVQALEFVNSRDRGPYRALLEDLAQVVGVNDGEGLLATSRCADLADYIYLTNQVMLALKWYKRFAQSVLGVEPAEEEI
ncbi:MAG: type III-B CRISPR module-associated protein Cmr5 [Chloroflexi bacterium]|nr:type III-B CRISPR module-associated protein Cmr5 [Chloroflexota bacterium]